MTQSTIATTPAYVRGDTWALSATVTNADGSAFSLSGCTVWWTLKEVNDAAIDDSAALGKLYWIDGGAASGIAVATPASGVAAITVPASVTAALLPKRYRYDVQVKNAAGEIKTVVIVEFTPTLDSTIRTTTP